MQSIWTILLALVFPFLAACGGGWDSEASCNYTRCDKFESHPYAVYRPARLDSHRSLLVLLHGAGQGQDAAEAMWQGRSFADANGYVLAIPQGTDKLWNYTSDIEWMLHFVDFMQQEEGPFDAVYLAGWSNGSMLSQQVACNTNGRITGVVSFAGERFASVPCTPAYPIAVSLIHGTADSIVSFSGGSFGTQGALAAFDFWRAQNACAADTEVSAPFFLERANTTSTRGIACRAPVELTVSQGGQHTPNWNIAGLHSMLRDFFDRAAAARAQ